MPYLHDLTIGVVPHILGFCLHIRSLTFSSSDALSDLGLSRSVLHFNSYELASQNFSVWFGLLYRFYQGITRALTTWVLKTTSYRSLVISACSLLACLGSGTPTSILGVGMSYNPTQVGLWGCEKLWSRGWQWWQPHRLRGLSRSLRLSWPLLQPCHDLDHVLECVQQLAHILMWSLLIFTSTHLLITKSLLILS